MAVEVRCFGPREPRATASTLRGYTPWERMGGKDGPRFVPALETLSIGLAMARDPVDADVVHAHTWYADMGALWIRTLYRIPLVVTLHSMEPLRPWKADQLGSGYLVSSWIERTAVESAHRVIAVSHKMREDILDILQARSRARRRHPQRHRSRPVPAHDGAATRSIGSACARPTCSSSGASPTRRASSTCWRRLARCRPTCRWCCAPPRPTRRRSRSGCGAPWPSSPT